MNDEGDDHGADRDEGYGDHGHDDHGDVEGLARETSPMQAYSMGQVWTGVLVAAVGVAVAFVVPLLLS